MNTKRLLGIAAPLLAVSTAGVAHAGTAPPTSEPATADSGATATAALDATFGTDGVLVANVNEPGHDRFISVVAGADGAAYASGYVDVGDGDHAFAVSKFTADGALDETYGDGGTAVVNVVEGGGDAEVGRGLVVADDGTVTVAGPADHDPAAAEPDNEDTDGVVIRLDPTGALDTTFGEGGIALVDFGAGKAFEDADGEAGYVADNAWGLAARDGGYVLFGTTPNQDADRTDADWVIAGFTDTGSLDEAFGDGGLVVADIDAADDNARHIDVDDEGRVLAAGYRRDGDGIVSPALIRLNPDGTFDETFGDGGIANHFVLDTVAEAYDVAIVDDGYVLTGYGRGADSETVDQIVFRFTADGEWDESFGEGGVTSIDIAGEDDRGRNLTVLPDGGILVVGSGKPDEANLDALVTLLDADGVPVAGFGDGGALLVDLGGANDAVFGVDVTADGAAVYVAGYKGAADDTEELDDAALIRLTLG
ncbi:MAG: hypothetical protein ACRD0G_19335 [Acidimicrobiales bacterium]